MKGRGLSECGCGKNKNSRLFFSSVRYPSPRSGSVGFGSVVVVVTSVQFADMANVVDTKLYDILGVSPTATENELKKVACISRAFSGREVVWAGVLS